jgi:FADH2 O2-dependent halogenase
VSAAFDLAVVGSGFGGSLLTLVARRLGKSVVLLERGRHPRFAIGESSSPLANVLLEELADRYDLPRVRPLAKWGTWRAAYPKVACGLKRGFTFLGHARGDRILVAASPRDEIADTHWYRPDFDAFLVEEARAAGAEYLDETRLDSVSFEAGGARLEGERRGTRVALSARFVVDASGPGRFLARALPLAEGPARHMPETETLYSHFTDVPRLDEMGLFPESPAPPYPPDDAALHHLFPGGWIWVLRFANGITSAGVAATRALGDRLRLSDGEPGWGRLLDELPTVRAHLAPARAALPFVHTRRLSFRVGRAAGDGWALLPSSAGFVDPLLSTGFPLTLLGVERLARALERGLPREDLEAHARATLEELDRASLLVAALYASFEDFPLFAALTMLYFAAASFSEACRRLGRPERAGSFLCGSHPTFGPALETCCRRALARDPADRDALVAEIARAVEPLNVAGLCDPARRGSYPVEAEDLLASAPKLGATRAEVEALLARMGMLSAREPR